MESAALLEQAGISAGVVNMRFVKPLDEAVLLQAADRKLVVTCEENALAGGFGAAVAEFYADHGMPVPMLRFGIPDAFIEQGTRKELLELCGLLPEQIAERVRKAWGNL